MAQTRVPLWLHNDINQIATQIARSLARLTGELVDLLPKEFYDDFYGALHDLVETLITYRRALHDNGVDGIDRALHVRLIKETYSIEQRYIIDGIPFAVTEVPWWFADVSHKDFDVDRYNTSWSSISTEIQQTLHQLNAIVKPYLPKVENRKEEQPKMEPKINLRIVRLVSSVIGQEVKKYF
jgi:hypothetical protein